MEEICLTERFESALIYAVRLHATQKRKGNGSPYVSHLLAVTALVLEAGGDEDLAIAALLHDAVEDQGGVKTLEEIRRRFGERVAATVDGCSDTYVMPKPPWRERKEKYLQHLPQASEDVRLVSLADKIHNARSILQGFREEGHRVWQRFRGGKEGTLWYYATLVDIFKAVDSSYLVDELERTVREIERLAALPAMN